MPRSWLKLTLRLRDGSRRASPHRSPMHMTSVVRLMTPTHREKVPADAALPRSSEARFPQGTGPFVFLLLFNPTPHRGFSGAAARAQRLLFHNSHRVPADHTGTVLNTGRRRGSVLGCPAPSRVCPRTSTGRFGVHVRSGGRLSRAATQRWLRKPAASRVDTAEMDLCPSAFKPKRRVRSGRHSRPGRSLLRAAGLAHRASTPARGPTPIGHWRNWQRNGLQNRRLRVQVLHGQPHQPKPFVELTLRGAQTGRNDWAASEPVTDNLFTSGEHHENERHPQLSKP